eukprot:PhM_4_TR15690/c2_g1_i1/m.54435
MSTPVEYNKEHYPNGLNAMFLGKTVDELKEKFTGASGLFESEKRDIAVNANAIVTTIAYIVSEGKSLLGCTVLDIGAGTGVLEPHLAKAVGPDGVLYTNELSPGFIELMTARAVEGGYDANTRFVLGTEHSVGDVPDGSVDVALMCDVYHHVEYVSTYMKDVRRTLKPDGRFVLIDFHRDPSRMTSHAPEWALEHIRANQATFTREIEECGFKALSEVDIPGLHENYCVCFGLN